MSNISTIVDKYAELDLQIKALTKQRDILKIDILAAAIYSTGKDGVERAIVNGEKADIAITKTYPNKFSKDLAETLLSAEDFLRCHAKAIEPTVTPKVTIKAMA
jgi:hypothetical protein